MDDAVKDQYIIKNNQHFIVKATLTMNDNTY